ncbi:MAG: glutamine-hydrolyzing GMP synthase [Treponema sp.]|jgi:GMP synthase (glutamine-hydrolysing)|nr:glutamine-hydrolyzing GMP synthase [Treponema sp.]
MMNKTEKILVLDFGSQTTALIGRRIREFGVYTEIIAGDAPLTEAVLTGVKGVILSGSPDSVYDEGIAPDKRIYECGIPLLGVCYGLQRMTTDLGGLVEPLAKMEYGGVEVEIQIDGQKIAHRQFLAAFDAAISLDQLLENGGSEETRAYEPLSDSTLQFSARFTAWMSHGDTLTRLAPGFVQAGTSASGFPAVALHQEKPWVGVQFHPEVSHCERGSEILAAFVFSVCHCKKEWTMERYVEEVRAELSARAGDNPVLLLISGGVDSTVVGALLLKTLPTEQAHLMYIDTGLMRKNETQGVKKTLEKLGAKNLYIIDAETEFLAALKGKEEPETKRKIIGDLFITIQEREVARLGLPESYFLAQGTLYTDLIESGKGVGKKARLIKSHHNVGSPLVDAKRNAGKIIEPLDRLYKDEVRALGRLLGVDEDVVTRHPFPGPGLAVRILGEVTREKCDILREADAIFIDELKRRRAPDGTGSLYDEVWQAFAALLPVRSVGVAGDSRKYGWALVLRAIVSSDGMTADVYRFPMKDLLEISGMITNTVKEIGRVTYDISSKPPATIEWE